MTFYLGNFRIDDEIEDQVSQAAKICKREIIFNKHPMPIDNPKIIIDLQYVDGFGSIEVLDGKRDCSKFWLEFNKLRK